MPRRRASAYLKVSGRLAASSGPPSTPPPAPVDGKRLHIPYICKQYPSPPTGETSTDRVRADGHRSAQRARCVPVSAVNHGQRGIPVAGERGAAGGVSAGQGYCRHRRPGDSQAQSASSILVARSHLNPPGRRTGGFCVVQLRRARVPSACPNSPINGSRRSVPWAAAHRCDRLLRWWSGHGPMWR
jgi:hypothetical protein